MEKEHILSEKKNKYLISVRLLNKLLQNKGWDEDDKDNVIRCFISYFLAIVGHKDIDGSIVEKPFSKNTDQAKNYRLFLAVSNLKKIVDNDKTDMGRGLSKESKAAVKDFIDDMLNIDNVH